MNDTNTATVPVFVWDNDYDNNEQVRPYYAAYLAVRTEMESRGAYPYNDDFKGKIPGLAGEHESTGIYLLQTMHRLDADAARMAAFVAAGGVNAATLEAGVQYRGTVVRYGFYVGGTGWSEETGARVTRTDGDNYVIIHKGKRNGLRFKGALMFMDGTPKRVAPSTTESATVDARSEEAPADAPGADDLCWSCQGQATRLTAGGEGRCAACPDDYSAATDDGHESDMSHTPLDARSEQVRFAPEVEIAALIAARDPRMSVEVRSAAVAYTAEVVNRLGRVTEVAQFWVLRPNGSASCSLPATSTPERLLTLILEELAYIVPEEETAPLDARSEEVPVEFGADVELYTPADALNPEEWTPAREITGAAFDAAIARGLSCAHVDDIEHPATRMYDVADAGWFAYCWLHGRTRTPVVPAITGDARLDARLARGQ